MARQRQPLVSRALALSVLTVLALLVAIPTTRGKLHRLAYAMGLRRPAQTFEAGDRLPNVPLQNVDGGAVALGNGLSRGVVVYNVFASWCPPCRAETPDVVRASGALARDGVRFVGIDQGESTQTVIAFTRAFGIHYTVLVDASHATTTELGARVIPETIVVRDGVVRNILLGPQTAPEIEQAAEGV
jgi:thiol-disulfide isomerase/thioredoxin